MSKVRQLANSRDDLIVDARKQQAAAEAEALLTDMSGQEEQEPAE